MKTHKQNQQHRTNVQIIEKDAHVHVVAPHNIYYEVLTKEVFVRSYGSSYDEHVKGGHGLSNQQEVGKYHQPSKGVSVNVIRSNINSVRLLASFFTM